MKDLHSNKEKPFITDSDDIIEILAEGRHLLHQEREQFFTLLGRTRHPARGSTSSLRLFAGRYLGRTLSVRGEGASKGALFRKKNVSGGRRAHQSECPVC